MAMARRYMLVVLCDSNESNNNEAVHAVVLSYMKMCWSVEEEEDIGGNAGAAGEASLL